LKRLTALFLVIGMIAAACGSDEAAAPADSGAAAAAATQAAEQATAAANAATAGIAELREQVAALGAKIDQAAATAAPAATGCGDGSGEVIAFSNTSSDTYQAAWQRGMKKTAAAYGCSVKFFENDYDQTEQNSQVQQQVGGGASPDAWAWMPPDAAAGAASLKDLSETGIPVIMVNQVPPAAQMQYVTLYAGVYDVVNGRTSGELIAQAREVMLADGRLTAGEPVKLAIIKFWPNFQASIDRLTGVYSVIGDAIDAGEYEIVAEAVDAVDAVSGYDGAMSIMPILQAGGVDIVYAQNDASASGVILALIESGITPGEDVLVIGGNCRDDVSDLTSGKQFGTGLQAAELEGEFAMQMIVNYLNNPTVMPGDYEAPATPDAYPVWPATVSERNFIPNPPVLGSEVDGFRLWGDSMVNWCSY